ncbi:ABC transporter ATP-binding protein [Streptomyces sp. B3I8]|uniref:ABC transporter ATP-binding protein n=1 Tax=Streptomyces sp. B3I8 TaxID=3042303 RepID=UPI00277DEB10|nr:ABC transporter ATP-binding protein [Streptomyces sp. B3I8]MDQ0791143.1 putative spermidine/putrescine transport system ATP-binding protein [Streptomyces sp. B3I8]
MPTTHATTPTPEAAAEAVNNRSGTRIRLTDVSKDFGLPEPAVDTISLTIEPGEFMTLLGPSGSGKTTTLNLIAGFETLTTGSIMFNGGDVSALPPHKRNLGMLFQNYALFPHLTVAQNVAYPLRERRLPKARITEKVGQVLELVQLTGRDKHYPSQLSGGQQQRVALARAIVFDPNALLLDEPLGALDRNLRGTLQQEIQRIHRELGSTFVFVTHDQEEAMNLSDRIALFNKGRLEQVGTPEALYATPETLFTARFLGDSNVFDIADAKGVTSGSAVAWEGRTLAVEAGTVSPRVTAGEPAALVVRPEDMRIATTPDEVPSGANHVSATVRQLDYLGSYRTAVLSLGGGGTVGRARLAPQEGGLREGQAVTAWWHVDRQRVVAR